MDRKRLTSIQQISEINLTPLMDLTFILLITFIITFPLIEQGIPVNLPTGNADVLEPGKTRTISLDVDGKLYLDELLTTLEELTMEMKALGVADSDTTVQVRADETIRYSRVVDVLKILHDAKITRMALVTQAESQ